MKDELPKPSRQKPTNLREYNFSWSKNVENFMSFKSRLIIHRPPSIVIKYSNFYEVYCLIKRRKKNQQQLCKLAL